MVAFGFIQLLFWIAVSTWFGGALFVAIAAPIIFQTVRDADPLLPSVLSVNLEGQHGTLLAGSIVGNLLRALARLELWCGGGLLLALVGQWVILDPRANWPLHALRSGLYLVAVGAALYEQFRLGPMLQRERDAYIEHADDPPLANAAKERFDLLHKESVLLLTVTLGVLLGLIFLSAGLAQPVKTIVVGH